MTVEIRKCILTKNDCYKAGRKITPKGIMVHSTGANNPKLSRYVQPDDGILGKNPYNNDWNRSGISKCVHAFIGKDKNGKARIYQTLPWNHRGWHGGGASNNTHIGFEICEDGLQDKKYFEEVYNLAVELCVYLCKIYKLNVKEIIDHSEGYKRGIASNHGDVMHWFPKHGKSMNTFRAEVANRLKGNPKVENKPKEEPFMLEKAIVFNSSADFGSVESLINRTGAPAYTRVKAEKLGEVAKELIIVGGGKGKLKAKKFTDLSGKDRFETAAKVAAYLK